MRQYFGAVALIFLLVLLIFQAPGLVTKVLAQRLVIDEYGQIYYREDGEVLGKDSDDEDKPTPTPERSQEVRTNTGTTKFEAKEGKVEVRVKVKNEAEPEEQEDEAELEMEEEEASEPAELVEEIEVREGIGKNTLKIKAKDGELEIEQRRVRARTNFPLTLGQNNELIVTTSAGTREVTILPDEAVRRLLQEGVFTEISATGSGELPGATVPGIATGTKQEIELKEERGALLYEARGIKDVRLLGLVPLAVPVTARISAETGVVAGVSQPWYFNFLGFLFRP